MRIQFGFVVFMVFWALLMSGCSSNKVVKTYSGSTLPNQAISILTAPENITLLSVNDQAVPQYLLSNLDVDYGLQTGDNLIVFKYESIWSKAKRDEETGVRVETVESEPMSVLIPAKAGKRYRFNFISANNVREAREMAAQFVAQVVDEKKNLIAESVPFTDYQKSLAEQQAKEKALELDKTVAQRTSEAGAFDEDMNNLSTLERLKLIWPNASADEKKAFLVWVFQK